MKKPLSVLLVLCAAVCLCIVLGTSASADVTHAHGTPITNGEELQNLFNKGGSGYLAADITLSEQAIVASDMEVSLCLNGHVLRGSGSHRIIYIYGTLTIDDCGTTVHRFTPDSSGLWVLDEAKGTKSVTGGVITGGNTETVGGGGICNMGTLTINRGNIVGNCAEYGGGINIDSTEDTVICNCVFAGNTASISGGAIYLKSAASICDCNIHDNIATNGGGIACSSAAIAELSRTAVTDNTATKKGGGIYANDNGCFAAGTKITMADGSVKNIEDIRDGDRIRTYDHETGELSSEEVQYVYRGEEQYAPFTLHFTNDIDINVVSGHDFLEKSTRKYVVITLADLESYVGKYFYNADADRWEQLLGATVQTEATDYYGIYSIHHINCVAEGMLSVCYDSAWLLNLFEKDEALRFDPVEKQADIEKYGLLAYEDAPYVTPETYDYWNVKYSNIGIGKGLISYDTLVRWCAYGYYYFLASQDTVPTQETMKTEAPSLLLGSEPLIELKGTEPAEATLRIGSGVVVKNNSSGTTPVTDNVYLTADIYCMLLEDAANSKVGITLEENTGRFTTNGTANDTALFFSDKPDYSVKYNSDGYLELVEDPTLYFAEDPDNTADKWLYTEKSYKSHYYADYGNSWSIEWNEAAGLPQLNLGLNEHPFSTDKTLQICIPCIINVTGTNTVEKLIVKDNVKLVGSGTLKIGSTNENALYVNAKVELAGGTLSYNGVNYPDRTLYMARANSSSYALYADEAYQFEYTAGKGTAWSITEEQANEQNYAALNLIGELNRNILFKQDANTEYIAVLRINGTDTKLGGFDVSEGTLTVQSAVGNKVISGDIKAQKLYLAECSGLTVKIENGSLIAAEKNGVANDLMIAGSAENKVKLTVENGGILFKNGTTSIVNAEVTVGKNSQNLAAEIGINANSIILDASALNISDVQTGVQLYDPKAGDNSGAILSLSNGSKVSIDAAGIGVQGTVGAKYYNNVSVLDAAATVTITGGEKAVASVGIAPVPDGKLVRSTDHRPVFFQVNKDRNSTGDYYYADTEALTPVKGLTLADITVRIAEGIEYGTVSVDDVGAEGGKTVTVTAVPNRGYRLDRIRVTDQNGKEIEVNRDNIFTLPADSNSLPVTVSAEFSRIPKSSGTYRVSVDEGLHGSVTASPKNAEKGDTVTVTVAPDKGYFTEAVTVTDDKGNTVEVKTVVDGERYTFTMPASPVTVQAVFAPVAGCPQDKTCVYAKYTDADTKAWYHDGVHYCVENGLMQGVSAAKFAPSGTLSRAMIVTVLWRMEGSPVADYAMTFRDVADGQWYTEAIRWAQATGVVSGYSDAFFGPDDNVTREQLAAILMRYASFKGVATSQRAKLSRFSDASSISAWALESIQWANAAGILNGRAGTAIAPLDTATRAEAAAMVQRFCQTVLQ